MGKRSYKSPIIRDISVDDFDDLIIIDSTSYAALANKTRAIIYGTAAAPTPTGYPDGCIYIQYTA